MSVDIIIGDCREKLRELPDESVHCCVTSPPYFGLRSYLRDDHPNKRLEIGLEATPEEYVDAMVDVFRQVRRVLRTDGTLWLNIGDSYAGSGRGGYPGGKSGLDGSHEGQDISRKARGSSKAAGFHEKARLAGTISRAWSPPPAGYKQKDLIGIPWMLAFALRADGWFLRQEIIWSKPNPMPESVRDRCTKSHESIFLLSKSPQYFYDADAIAEGRAGDEDANGFRGGCYVGGEVDNGTLGKRAAAGNKRVRGVPPRHAQYPDSSDQSGLDDVGRGGKRNKRSVWTVATQPFKEAHFATFPSALIEPCILAGCPVGGTVLDIFGGSGTTGMVAQSLGRRAILIDLNDDYEPMAERRVRNGNIGLPLGTAA